MAREKKKTVLMCIHRMKGIHHVIDPSLMVDGFSKISDFVIQISVLLHNTHTHNTE
jgi:hypothetical protein